MNPLDWLRRRRHPLNGYRGVFASFEEAMRAAPPGKATGYDNPDAASFYRDLLDEVRHDDYPAVHWLYRALQQARAILEIGGHVGVAYYSFQKLIGFPAGLSWTILDTEPVAEAGRRLAAERGRQDLHFISDFSQISGPVDVLFASGSLQYVPAPLLPERIAALPARPEHILINKTPVTDAEGFVTLQDIGVSYCPYRIHSRRELLEPLLGMGYELVDSWRKERRLAIAGAPERTLEHFSGFYLRASR